MPDASDSSGPGDLTLYLHLGDSFNYAVEYHNDIGARFDLTDWTVAWTFAVGSDEVVATVINGKISVTANIIYLALDSADTLLLDGIGRHSLKITKTPLQETLLVGDVIISD